MAYKIYLTSLLLLFGILIGGILSEEVPERRNTRSAHATVLRDGGWGSVPVVRVRYIYRQQP